MAFGIGIVATLVGQVLWEKKVKKFMIEKDVLDIHGKVKVYLKRDKVAEQLQKITGSTRGG